MFVGWFVGLLACLFVCVSVLVAVVAVAAVPVAVAVTVVGAGLGVSVAGVVVPYREVRCRGRFADVCERFMSELYQRTRAHAHPRQNRIQDDHW